MHFSLVRRVKISYDISVLLDNGRVFLRAASRAVNVLAGDLVGKVCTIGARASRPLQASGLRFQDLYGLT